MAFNISIADPNGRPERQVTVERNGKPYVDWCIPQSRFSRSKLMEGIALYYGVAVESLADLEDTLIGLALNPPEATDTPIEYTTYTCADFMRLKFEERWLVDYLIAEGQPLIVAGGKKTLKTSLLVDFVPIAGNGREVPRFLRCSRSPPCRDYDGRIWRGRDPGDYRPSVPGSASRCRSDYQLDDYRRLAGVRASWTRAGADGMAHLPRDIGADDRPHVYVPGRCRRRICGKSVHHRAAVAVDRHGLP